MRIALLIAALLTAASPAGAETITGRASVIDGDTLEIHGERIRLHGIDAPESVQRCQDAAGAGWPCGRRAAFAIADLVERRVVSCDGRDRDHYGRLVAVCSADGTDLGAWLVSRGLALAYRRYSEDYVPQEEEAAASRRGIWAGTFIPPWDWRRGKR